MTKDVFLDEASEIPEKLWRLLPARGVGEALHRAIHKGTVTIADESTYHKHRNNSGYLGGYMSDKYGAFDALCSKARQRGRYYLLVQCPCGWKGKHDQLTAAQWRGGKNPKAMRRPDGFCPECRKHPFWMPLSEAQAAVLAP